MWHERQLLIDGKLVDAADGAVFPTINPATEEVLGTAADAGPTDAAAAVAAARRAFDTTDWSRDHAFRAHCLRQLHEALTFRIEEMRSITVAEAGAPVLLTRGGPQLEAPVEMVRWHADLLDSYDWTEDLGVAESVYGSHRRWIEREAAGVVAAITPYNFPTQINLAKLAPALAAGCAVVLKGAPDTPWSALALGRLIAQRTDIPAGMVNVLSSSGAAASADAGRARAVARRIRTGTVSVNGGVYYGPDAPFGGYKQSGIGREMGVAGFEEFLEIKTLAEPAP